MALPFYQGYPNREGVSIFDVWEFSFEEMEKNHRYIQYLFPLPEPSSYYPDAPLLSDKEIESFRKSPVLLARVKKSLRVMIDFYGYHFDERGFIVPSGSFMERSRVWLTPDNHNHLRITRILRCLELLGLEVWRQLFLIALCNTYKTYPQLISRQSRDLWFRGMI